MQETREGRCNLHSRKRIAKHDKIKDVQQMSISNRAARKKALTTHESVMKLEELEQLREYATIRSTSLCIKFIMGELHSRLEAGESIGFSDAAFIATYLYEAGRIDGKREERARRRAAQIGGKDDATSNTCNRA